MNDELLIEIKKLNKLLILLLTKDYSQINKIQLLNKAGFTPKEISELLGTSPNTVSVALVRINKREIK
jgi:hypothetical protein